MSDDAETPQDRLDTLLNMLNLWASMASIECPKATIKLMLAAVYENGSGQTFNSFEYKPFVQDLHAVLSSIKVAGTKYVFVEREHFEELRDTANASYQADRSCYDGYPHHMSKLEPTRLAIEHADVVLRGDLR